MKLHIIGLYVLKNHIIFLKKVLLKKYHR